MSLFKAALFSVLMFLVGTTSYAQSNQSQQVPDETARMIMPIIMQSMNALDGISASIDCTPICGTPYCCVAASIEVPYDALPASMQDLSNPGETMLCDFSCGGHCPNGGGCCFTWGFSELPTE